MPKRRRDKRISSNTSNGAFFFPSLPCCGDITHGCGVQTWHVRFGHALFVHLCLCRMRMAILDRWDRLLSCDLHLNPFLRVCLRLTEPPNQHEIYLRRRFRPSHCCLCNGRPNRIHQLWYVRVRAVKSPSFYDFLFSSRRYLQVVASFTLLWLAPVHVVCYVWKLQHSAMIGFMLFLLWTWLAGMNLRGHFTSSSSLKLSLWNPISVILTFLCVFVWCS